MDIVTLKNGLCLDALIIPSGAVNKMLDEANESQIKIYLYLLKNKSCDVTVSEIADYFNYTEADVKRALNFWNGGVSSKKTKALPEKDLQGDNVVAFSVRPSYSKEKIMEFATVPEVSQLLFVAEQYMGRPLKSDDISSVLYMYDSLGFSVELIEYLMEYCLSNNKKSFRSIEAVAGEWKEAGILNIDDAKKFTRQVPKDMPKVYEALGIDKNHQPIDAEITYVRKWTEIYGYKMDIISQACERTILTINKPSFKYVNSILKGWHEQGVKTIADILESDEQFKQKKVSEISDTKKQKSSAKAANNKFKNFSEREYDFDSLMKDILSN